MKDGAAAASGAALPGGASALALAVALPMRALVALAGAPLQLVVVGLAMYIATRRL